MEGAEQSRLAHAPSKLTIDLGAVVTNYQLLAKKCATAKCAAVVKANAYGLGVIPIVKALDGAGCRTFFVATLDEGIELRQITKHTIYVLNGISCEDPREYQAYTLRPVLNDLDQITIWRRYSDNTRLPPAAIHIDTGMNRLGLSQTLLAQSGKLENLYENLDVSLIMSHLACADEWHHEKNLDQLRRFQSLISTSKIIPASLSASSGIFLGPNWHFDLVRPGFAIYGGNPQPATPNPLDPVVRLSAKILQCRTVAKGDTVGYGACHKFSAEKRIATIAVGYADGFFRSLASRGTVFIGKTPLTILGRVSMDLIAIDITGVDGVKASDWVDIVGPYQDVDALAATAGTIGYEVLTALGQRHQREYVGAIA